MGAVKAVKGVKFHYRQTPQTGEVLETFRTMVNHAIHICLEEGIQGRLKLRNRIYREFQERYGVVSCYPYSVAEVAWSMVKKHKRWQRRPFADKLMMKMDAANYSLNYAILSLPSNRGKRVLIPLEYGAYQRSFLMDTTLKRGSVTMTDSAIVIAFSKEAVITQPLSAVGYDLNEKSIVGSNGMRIDLAEAAGLHTEYGVRRREYYQRNHNDTRLEQKFASSRRERERVKQALHRVSMQIVEKARKHKETIVLERLRGIRYAHQKGNGECRARRRRIALWPFRQLQGYIDYKARWAGVSVEYVSATMTSKTCSNCGFVNRKLKLTEREWQCPSCRVSLDRGLNAAVNIVRRGKMPCLGVVRPGARGRDEAMTPERNDDGPNPVAEAPKVT